MQRQIATANPYRKTKTIQNYMRVVLKYAIESQRDLATLPPPTKHKYFKCRYVHCTATLTEIYHFIRTKSQLSPHLICCIVPNFIQSKRFQ